MAKRYTIAQAGLGARGETSLKAFMALDERLEVIGISDINPRRLDEIAERYGFPPEQCFTDTEAMLKACRPELFSFCTLPSVRLDLVELAARYGVKGILFEKPMATSLAEAKRIVEVCRAHNIKAVVCHQHKYLEGFLELKRRLNRGELGRIQRITTDCQAWFSQLGTHYIDYAIWANGGSLPTAVAGHVHGRDMLSDSHPSPDHMLGEIVFENGVHATVQFGYMSIVHRTHDEDYAQKRFPVEFWEDDRLTVYGDTGYAWAECNGNWSAFTRDTNGEVVSGRGNAFRHELDDPRAQIAFTRDFLDWMDDDAKGHSCNVETAYAGFETAIAIAMSAVENRRVDLPLDVLPADDVIEKMRDALPECPRRKL